MKRKLHIITRFIVFCLLTIISFSYGYSKTQESQEEYVVKYKEPNIRQFHVYRGLEKYVICSDWKYFKDDAGHNFNIEVQYTRDGETGEILYFIGKTYRGGSHVVVPKGDELLIKTGSGKVFTGKTLREYGSDIVTRETNWGHGTFTKNLEFTEIEAYYNFSMEAAAEIAKYGILKVREHAQTDHPEDFNFTGKKFYKISNPIGSLTEYMGRIIKNQNVWNKYLEYRKELKEKKAKENEIPEF